MNRYAGRGAGLHGHGGNGGDNILPQQRDGNGYLTHHNGDGKGSGNHVCSADEWPRSTGDGYADYDSMDARLIDVRCWCGGIIVRVATYFRCERCNVQLTHRQIVLLAEGTDSAMVALRLGVR